MDGYEAIAHYFPLPDYRVSIVHGQMKAVDKEFEMQRFIKGETQIMVATTVIEVGVNVPNASVMIIESAERFGLSQLHQLRGVTSMFNFGQTFGAIKGICATLELPIFFVRPAKWKKHFELINSSKDASRTKAIEMYPHLAEKLSRKKDVNKSDAILIARFYSETRFKEES